MNDFCALGLQEKGDREDWSLPVRARCFQKGAPGTVQACGLQQG